MSGQLMRSANTWNSRDPESGIINPSDSTDFFVYVFENAILIKVISGIHITVHLSPLVGLGLRM